MSERYTYICEIFPRTDTEDGVMELWKDNKMDVYFAVDAVFLDQVGNFHNPYTGEIAVLPIPE